MWLTSLARRAKWLEGREGFDLDDVLMTAIEAGAEDAVEDEMGRRDFMFVHDYIPLIDALADAGITPDRSEVVQARRRALGVEQTHSVLD